MAAIDERSVHSGRVYKENSEYVNVADVYARNTGKQSDVSFTRSTAITAYAAGSVVTSNTSVGAILTFSSVGSSGDLVMVLGTRARFDVTSVPTGMTTFKLHVYNASPTAIADGVVWTLSTADASKYLGYLTLSTPVDVGSYLWSQDDGRNEAFMLSTSALYGILVTNTSFTPTASAVKNLSLQVVGV